MVGNDIVDIAQAKKDSNWQRPRFLDKLFTENEKNFIFQSEDKCIAVWTLWSMKEAAYKLYIQQKLSRFYAPKQFECEIKEKLSVVRFKDFKCYVSTKITSEYIISEARLKIKLMTSKVIKFKSSAYKSQSKTIRQEALKFLNNADENAAIVNSKFNIPSLETDSKVIPISLTHHGKFGAFAIA